MTPPPQIHTLLLYYSNTAKRYMARIWPSFATRTLDIRGLRLTCIPAELWKFSFISIIRAADNRLENLPMSLSRLTALRELDIQRNFIRAIPTCITCMPHLARIDWDGNPLYFPPRAVMYTPPPPALCFCNNLNMYTFIQRARGSTLTTLKPGEHGGSCLDAHPVAS